MNFLWKTKNLKVKSSVRKEYRKVYPDGRRCKGKGFLSCNIKTGRKTMTKLRKTKLVTLFLMLLG